MSWSYKTKSFVMGHVKRNNCTLNDDFLAVFTSERGKTTVALQQISLKRFKNVHACVCLFVGV